MLIFFRFVKYSTSIILRSYEIERWNYCCSYCYSACAFVYCAVFDILSTQSSSNFHLYMQREIQQVVLYQQKNIYIYIYPVYIQNHLSFLSSSSSSSSSSTITLSLRTFFTLRALGHDKAYLRSMSLLPPATVNPLV